MPSRDLTNSLHVWHQYLQVFEPLWVLLYAAPKQSVSINHYVGIKQAISVRRVICLAEY